MRSIIPGWRRRGLLGAGAALAAGRALRAQPAEGATHALIVGIDAYGMKPLRGCVNDAGLVERSVLPLVASATVLRDGQATWTGFDAAWEGVAARLRSGDRLLFTFAGHGNRLPRPDGRPGLDNFLVFQGYNIATAPRDILTDSEIEQRFAALGRRGISVVFVADCCHSGALTRSADRAAQLTTRTQADLYSLPQLTQSMAAGPPPPPPPRPEELQHVHFYAACQPAEVVPEIRWEGAQHGALSVALAEGLRGAADADRDGVVTARELADYVVRTVRGTADVRQTPDFKPGTRAPAVLFRVRASTPEPAAATGREVLRLRIEGAAPPGLPPLRDVELLREGAYDLLWRPGSGQTVSALGDVLAQDGVTAERLPASIARLRALARFQKLLAQSPMEIRLEGALGAGRDVAGDVHVKGTVLRLVLDGVREPHLVVFNIAGDGTVQNVYPRLRTERAVTPAGGRTAVEGVTVVEPYGTDRFVAVAAERPLDGLAAGLKALDELRDPLAAADAVERAVAGGRFQLGLGARFSKAR